MIDHPEKNLMNSNAVLRIDQEHRMTGSFYAAKIIASAFKNKYFLLLFHAILFVQIYFLVFAFRFDIDFVFRNPGAYYSFLFTLGWVVSIKLIVFYFNHHCHDIWYYASTKDLQQLVISSSLSLVFIYTAKSLFFPSLAFSRMIPILDAVMTVVILGGIRLTLRTIREDIQPKFFSKNHKNTLLVGANHEGGKLALSIHSYPELGHKIIGFITIHPSKVNALIGHIPILGHLDDIQNVAKKHHVTDILVVAGILDGKKMRELSEACKATGLNLRIVPQIDHRLGNRSIPLRHINIDDLLKRDPIRLDDSKIRHLVKGRRILVTGAGGSIGSEICRQLVRFQPENLMILGRGENRIFFLERELKEMNFASTVLPIIADITNAERMNNIFDEYRPDVVFHAAAHKHVPLMESNISEAIRNNIYGTKVLADLSDEYEVKTFVLVSTDKAVHPTSIMGTTKHMAERYIHAMSSVSSTRFVVTRFGNVLGSTGSVVPIFREQIQRGGPITITDERMTRYFMTIPEASQLVLQAAAMGQGGEIFVLDMGEPVKIVDLAKDMIRLAGLPENAIDIQFSGSRPGEKLYEELYFDSETTLETDHPKLRAAQHRSFPIDLVRKQVDTLCTLLDDVTQSDLRKCLMDYVPEYKPFQEQTVPSNKQVVHS